MKNKRRKRNNGRSYYTTRRSNVQSSTQENGTFSFGTLVDSQSLESHNAPFEEQFERLRLDYTSTRNRVFWSRADNMDGHVSWSYFYSPGQHNDSFIKGKKNSPPHPAGNRATPSCIPDLLQLQDQQVTCL